MSQRPLRLPVAAAPAPQPAPVAAAPASDPNSPLGVWATEENKGNVRIEPCGANLCGYSVKTNEKILISMKPQGSKWTGQIHDPDSGRNYDSTIALKGTNSAPRAGLRLRRHVLRRPDLEARQLTIVSSYSGDAKASNPDLEFPGRFGAPESGANAPCQ